MDSGPKKTTEHAFHYSSRHIQTPLRTRKSYKHHMFCTDLQSAEAIFSFLRVDMRRGLNGIAMVVGIVTLTGAEKEEGKIGG